MIPKKYIKYLWFLVPIAIVILIGYFVKSPPYSDSQDSHRPILPPHSDAFAYKSSYVTPVNNSHTDCRANIHESGCNIMTCEGYHYNFSNCVYRQPKSVVLAEEDGKESPTGQVIKALNYY